MRDLQIGCVVVSLVCALALQQITSASGRQGSAVIRITGVVVEGESNQPVPGVKVEITAADSRIRRPEANSLSSSFMTSSDGRFRFEVPSGTAISLSASKAGYVGGYYGQRFPTDSSEHLQLTTSTATAAVVLRVWRPAVIAGSAKDEAGEPLVGAEVRAYRERIVAGRLSLLPDRLARVDDQGAYRLTNLLPGRYAVALVSGQSVRARAPNAPVETEFLYTTMFFPHSAALSAAEIIELRSGAERSGIDFALKAVPVFDVAGTVTGLSPSLPMQLRLLRQEPGSSEAETEIAATFTDNGGRFRLHRIPSGNYRLRGVAFPTPAAPEGTVAGRQRGNGGGISGFQPGRGKPLAPVPVGATKWVDQQVTVADKAIPDLVMPAEVGARFSGRVDFIGSDTPPRLDQILATPILVLPADGRDLGTFPVAGIAADGTFRTVALPPGQYVLLAFPSLDGWLMQSVVLNGRDFAGQPIMLGGDDVTDVRIGISRTPTGLNGVVRDGFGKPVVGANVYLFPAIRRLWRDYGTIEMRHVEARTNSAGAFGFSGLLPGEYYGVALDRAPREAWRNPDLLETTVGLATAVSIKAGAISTQDLRLQLAPAKGASFLNAPRYEVQVHELGGGQLDK
jgi:carboxypeptidase family protein